MEKWLLIAILLLSLTLTFVAFCDNIDDEESLEEWIEDEKELCKYREDGHRPCMEECLVRAYAIGHCMNYCD